MTHREGCPHLGKSLRQYLDWIRSLEPDHPCLYCIRPIKDMVDRDGYIGLTGETVGEAG